MLQPKSTPIPSNFVDYKTDLLAIKSVLEKNDRQLENEKPGELETIEYFIEKILLSESGKRMLEYVTKNKIPPYPSDADIRQISATEGGNQENKDLYLLENNPLADITTDENVVLLISQYREYNKNLNLQPPYVAFDTRRYNVRKLEEDIATAKRGDAWELKEQLPALEQLLAAPQIPVLVPAADIYFKQGKSTKDRGYFAFHNLQKIGIQKAWSRESDGYYVNRELPREKYFDAMKKVLPQDAQEYITNLENRYEKQVATRKLKLALKESKNAMYTVLSNDKYAGIYNTIKTQLPDFEQYALQNNIFQYNFAGIAVDEQNNCVVYATNRSQSYGTGPMKYYLEITVRHKGQVQKFEYAYRSPSNINQEDRSRARPHLSIQNASQVDGNTKFEVTVQNSGQTKKQDYSAVFSDKTKQNIDSAAFQKKFSETCEQLRQGQTRTNGVERVQKTNSFKNREEAIIKEQYIDTTNGIGAVIIQTQIDAGVTINENKDKQYGFYGYIITADGKTEQVRSTNGREKQLGWMPGFEKETDHNLVGNISSTTAVSLVQKWLTKK